MYLTSLPWVTSVCSHGRKPTPLLQLSANSVYFVYNVGCDKCVSQLIGKSSGQVSSFLAKTSYEFVTSCNNRGLKIKVVRTAPKRFSAVSSKPRFVIFLIFDIQRVLNCRTLKCEMQNSGVWPFAVHVLLPSLNVFSIPFRS